jgi:hypothetical protein
MKVLFIGGTGVISSACSPLAVERGMDLYLLNRGQTRRPIPCNRSFFQGAREIIDWFDADQERKNHRQSRQPNI